MNTYRIDVLETAVILKTYEIRAANLDEARAKALTGEIVAETFICDNGVIDREIA